MLALCCGLAGPGQAQRTPFDDVKWETPPPRPAGVSSRTLRYGRRSWQTIDLSVPRGAARAPLVVLVPDTVFRAVGPAYPTDWVRTGLDRAGFAVALVDFRPARTGPGGAAADLAAAIAFIRQTAARDRIDADRIALVGLGSGAHFAFLLATDEHVLGAAGVPFATLRAAVAVNGDGFDIPRRIATASRYRGAGYREVFGRDPAVQTRYSPIAHLAAPNAPHFLTLALRDPSLAEQAREMTAALTAAGVAATSVTLPDVRERDLATIYLALPAGAGSETVDFLHDAFGRR